MNLTDSERIAASFKDYNLALTSAISPHETCGLDANCSFPYSRCFSGTCVCQYGHYQEFEACKLGSTLGENCNRDEQCLAYTFNSICKDQTCQCEENYYVFKQYYCKRGSQFSNACNTTRDCLDFSHNTICDKNRCRCSQGFVFDSQMQQCRKGLLGDSCDEADLCGEFVEHSGCIDGACRCKTGYKETNNLAECQMVQKKRSHYGALPSVQRDSVYLRSGLDGACNSNSDCSVPFTTCQEQKCLCLKDYKAVDGFCLYMNGSHIGMPCKDNRDCSILYTRCMKNVCGCIVGYKAIANACAISRGGKHEEPCKSQQDCKGRFTYCSTDLKCECLDGYHAQGQDCVPSYGVGETCANKTDCMSGFSTCMNGICQCEPEFYMQGFECVPLMAGIIGDSCIVDKQCGLPYSVCQNNVCQCQENYYSQGFNCAPSNFLPFGKSCDSDADCPVSDSTCQGGQCFCASDRYQPLGYECVIERGVVKRHMNSTLASPPYSYVGSLCSRDEDCFRPIMICDHINQRCICAPGHLLDGLTCRISVAPLSPVAGLPIVYPRIPPPQYPPREINSEPTTYITQPGHYQINSYEIREPAYPDNAYTGAYGHPCSTTLDCNLWYMYCNPIFNKCDCNLGYKLEDDYCVRKVTFPPGVSNVQTQHKLHAVTYGHSCTSDANCYSEGLVCDRNSYVCVCAPYYKIQGRYCVAEFQSQPTPLYKRSDDKQNVPPLLNTPDSPSQAPGYVPTQPITGRFPPTSPGYAPYHPASPGYAPYHPASPGHFPYNPASPGYAPYNPASPGYAPYNPASPGYAPYNPASPGYAPYNPASPGFAPYNPASPGYAPYNPASPGYAPYNPASPGYAPYNPTSPGYAPYNPTSPGYAPYNPTSPGYAPYHPAPPGYAPYLPAPPGYASYHPDSPGYFSPGYPYPPPHQTPSNYMHPSVTPDQPGYPPEDPFITHSQPLSHVQSQGRLNDYCNTENQCNMPYTTCYETKCQCANTFYQHEGQCYQKDDYFPGYCRATFECQIPNSVCSSDNQKCKCHRDYTKFLNSCRHAGTLHGQCSPYGVCSLPELTCNRLTFRCVCAAGYRNDSDIKCVA